MCLVGAVRGWQGHCFHLCVGAAPAVQVAWLGGCTCPGAAVQLGIFLSVVDIYHLPCRSRWVSLPFLYSLLLSQLYQLTAVCEDSSLLSAFCTGSKGPCSEEIGAALLREAAHGDVTSPGPPSRGELGLPHTPWLSTSHVVLKVAFLVLSCKEEHNVMMMIPLFPTPHSAPSFSGVPTLCEQSRGLLPRVFLPSPPRSVPLTFLSTCTGCCRTEKSCGSFFFSIFS